MKRKRTHLALTGLAAGVIALSSCDPDKDPVTRERPRQEAYRAAWIDEDPADWPQLVLTNRAEFKGHTSLHGASGFLVRNSQGDVFYASAAHLLGAAGGVEPEVSQSNLDAVLDSWVVYPRTKKDEWLAITGLAGTPSPNPHIDWMFLKVETPDRTYPAVPLEIDSRGVGDGDTVYLVGVPYSDKESSQNVYKAVVQERELSTRFRYTLETPVDLRGFSGAPILNDAGEVAGVMTVDFNPKTTEDGLHMEGGGEVIGIVEDRLEAATP